MSIDRNRPVGELVAERIGRARVFDNLGIDYCCHGKAPLAEACRRLGLDAAEVVADIERSDSEPARADDPDYRAMPLGRLADHIESTRHVFMNHELPRLVALRGKVASAHGDRHPELFELGEVLDAFRNEIDSHQMKEERVLFPLIRQAVHSHARRAVEAGGSPEEQKQVALLAVTTLGRSGAVAAYSWIHDVLEPPTDSKTP